MRYYDRKALLNLVEQLNACVQPDRSIDLALERTFNTSSIHGDELDKNLNLARHYTGSIDAAIHLGRMVPGLFLPALHTKTEQTIPSNIRGADFIPVFARKFCLEVVKAVLEKTPESLAD